MSLNVDGKDDNTIPATPLPSETHDSLQEIVETPLKKLKLSLEAEVLPLPKIEKVLNFCQAISQTKNLFGSTWSNNSRTEFNNFYTKLREEGAFDEQELIQIIKDLATQPFFEKVIVKELINLDIKDTNVLFECMQSAIKYNAIGVGPNIKNCHFNPQQRLEIARLLAQTNPSYFYRSFICFHQDFGLENEQELTILKMVPKSISNSFDHFNFNQMQRFELACIAAKVEGGNIFNTKLDLTPNQMFEVAKIAAAQTTSIHDHRYIKILQYDFNENQRFELAKLVAPKCGTSLKFQEFRLTDPSRLFEIAKMTFQSGFNARYFSQEINFLFLKITNPDHLFELAKLAANNDCVFSERLDNYKISDPKKLFELAKIAAINSPINFAKFFRNFKIDNQDQILELVTLTLQNDPTAIKYINNFGPINPEILYNIAKTAAQKKGVEILGLLNNYGVTDTNRIHEIAALAYNYMGENFINRENFEFNDYLAGSTSLNANLQEVLDITKLQEKINLWDNDVNKKKYTYVLNTFIVLCKLHPNQNGLASFLKLHKDLLPTIFEEREPYAYWPLLNGVLSHGSKEIKEPIANTIEKQMTVLLVDYVKLNDADKGPIIQKLQQCDIRDIRLRTPIMYLINTLKTENLTPAQTKKIFDWVLENPKDKNQIATRCWVVRAIPNLNGQLGVELESGSLETSLIRLFQKLLPQLQVNDLSNRLQDTFFNMRKPIALLIYAGRLATLQYGKEESLDHLATVVNSVLNKKFKQTRQNVDSNEHLKFLQQNHPDILKKYHKGIDSKQVELEDHVKQEATHEALRKSIINALNHDHLKDEDLSKVNMKYIPVDEQNFALLRKALNGEVKLEEIEANIKEKLIEKGQAHKINPEQFKKLDSYIVYLKLQTSLIRLMTKNVTEANFNECRTAFQKAIKGEFLNDLKDMASVFTKTKEVNSVILNDTDDPYEIMLCGSEVEGSCQRLEGDPQLNRGILGYLLNGQTRLITCKEPGDDIIKGRAVIRLLIDDNNKPVLQMEGFYPRSLSPKLKQALLKFALEKAKALNVPLVSKEVEADEMKPFMGIVKNLGVQAPEYVDSATGIKEDYKLDKLKEILK